MKDDAQLPALLAAAHELDFDYADGQGYDFEPYEVFLPPDETQEWFRAWTGNDEADGSCFRVFGQDGTGGYAAIWTTLPNAGLEEQPIVFLGSEGESGRGGIEPGRLRSTLGRGTGAARSRRGAGRTG